MHSPINSRAVPALDSIPALAVSILAAVLAAPPSVAVADSAFHQAPESAALHVSLADLDLGTTAGYAAARERIKAAVLRLCHGFSDERKVDNLETQKACFDDALPRALNRLAVRVAAADTARSHARESHGSNF